jgi:hypothetical protein
MLARVSFGMRLMRRACSLALLLALAVPLAAPTVVAQDDPLVEMARERFQEGVKFYDAKQYEKARLAFLQAYALKKHPAVLLNLAQSELRSGHEQDAAKHFAQYLRDNTQASAMERQEAERGLAAAKAHVAEIAVTVVSGAGAEVLVAGATEGVAPLPGPIYLKPGNHTVEARRGGRVGSQVVTAAAGQSGSVSISLTGAESGAPGPVGPAPSEPGAPPVAGPGPQGDPQGGGVTFDSSEGRQPFPRWVMENKVAWVGGGVTALGLVGGIIFAVSAKNSYDSADSVKEQILAKAVEQGEGAPCSGQKPFFATACQQYDDNVSEGDTYKTLATVSFIVAGAAAAGTVVYYFVDSGKKQEATARPVRPKTAVVPLAGPGFSGLSVIGQF